MNREQLLKTVMDGYGANLEPFTGHRAETVGGNVEITASYQDGKLQLDARLTLTVDELLDGVVAAVGGVKPAAVASSARSPRPTQKPAAAPVEMDDDAF